MGGSALRTKRSDTHIFSYYHPAVIFAYFAGAAAFSMATFNPVYVAASLVCASIYLIYLHGARAFAKSAAYAIPLFVVVVAFNALFNGMGMTVLGYFGGTPITAEAIAYGTSAAAVLFAVFTWFACYQEIMTSDKFLALFGGIAPTSALLISMTLRFVPLAARRAKRISTAQNAALGSHKRTFREQARLGTRLATVLTAWSMESSIETADSMQVRAYGTQGRKRTHYANDRLTLRDGILLALLIALIAANIFFFATQAPRFEFYPTINNHLPHPAAVLVYVVFLLTPLLLEGREQLAWARATSR